MTADNRTVTTDALETLGSIIGEGEKRDAIHLAVEPVTATEKCFAGQHVGLLSNGSASLFAETKLGIVDPFLTSPVEPGERFWLVVYPRQISSLRHVWEHPAFPASGETEHLTAGQNPTKAESEAWLRAFCAAADCPGYEETIGKATEAARGNKNAWDSDYLHWDGIDAHGEIPPAFWDHLEVVLGEPIPRENRASYFSCSC